MVEGWGWKWEGTDVMGGYLRGLVHQPQLAIGPITPILHPHPLIRSGQALTFPLRGGRDSSILGANPGRALRLRETTGYPPIAWGVPSHLAEDGRKGGARGRL